MFFIGNKADAAPSLLMEIILAPGVELESTSDIWTIETGGCAFEVVNLDPCEDIDIVPTSILNGFCQSMYLNCAANKQDGLINDTDPHVAMALLGLAAAPPYRSPSC